MYATSHADVCREYVNQLYVCLFLHIRMYVCMYVYECHVRARCHDDVYHRHVHDCRQAPWPKHIVCALSGMYIYIYICVYGYMYEHACNM